MEKDMENEKDENKGNEELDLTNTLSVKANKDDTETLIFSLKQLENISIHLLLFMLLHMLD